MLRWKELSPFALTKCQQIMLLVDTKNDDVVFVELRLNCGTGLLIALSLMQWFITQNVFNSSLKFKTYLTSDNMEVIELFISQLQLVRLVATNATGNIYLYWLLVMSH